MVDLCVGFTRLLLQMKLTKSNSYQNHGDFMDQHDTAKIVEVVDVLYKNYPDKKDMRSALAAIVAAALEGIDEHESVDFCMRVAAMLDMFDLLSKSR
jgi:hypothetical protein